MVTFKGSGSFLALSRTWKLSKKSHLALLGINSSVQKLYVKLIYTLQSYLTGSNEMIYANEFRKNIFMYFIINKLILFWDLFFSREKFPYQNNMGHF